MHLKQKNKILFVGGGTGGHILPLTNLIEKCMKEKMEVSFVLADQAIDRTIIKQNFESTPLRAIFLRTGKIRRYFSWKNFQDFFRILTAIFEARKILNKTKPDIIFFKGGFVCFPVLIAAKYLFPTFKGKIYLHESDSTPSNLAKLISRHTDQTFSNFGTKPLRLFYSNLKIKRSPATKLKKQRKIFIFGGSQGAQFINEIFHKNAERICQKYFVSLICGPGKTIPFKHKNFEQFELLKVDEFAQKLSEADLIISRGSASLFQILEQKKKSIIIPLPSSARNHQLKNTQYFKDKGLIKMLLQDAQSSKKLYPLIETTMKDTRLQEKLEKSNIKNNVDAIFKIITAKS